MNQGGLFTYDYLSFGIMETPEWKALDDARLTTTRNQLRALFEKFPHDKSPTEARTEDDLIWPVLNVLGWNASVRQQALSAKGRDHIPDGLLFADEAAKARSDKRISFEKYEDGLCLVESKKWGRPLDRPGSSKDDRETPSSQMLRYLRRVEDLTSGKLRWGILTNGRLWRIYFQGAKSVAEDFCEIDLAALLGLAGFTDLATPNNPDDWLKVFILIFCRESFLPSPGSARTFHDLLLDEGRFYEENVAKDLSKVVFGEVFPKLALGLAAHDPDAPENPNPAYLGRVKEATLVLLYRLLFVLYAEDRNLLPVSDKRYDDYGMRKKLREDIQKRIDSHDVFSDTRSGYWDHAKGLFEGIAKGDKSIGLPPYNGGLFDATRQPLLDRIKLPDAIFAPALDKLCRIERDGAKRHINYRDLSVQQLGSIYEKLLEYEVAPEDDKLIIRLNPFARKGSGSYYTPDELVRLIIERTIGPLIHEKIGQFEKTLNKKDDPAEAILDMKICDPAMGSGHFLVDLVDYLADRVIEATVIAGELSPDYTSPLIARIAAIRAQILTQAKAHGWTVNESQLDDRLIVRRMVLKRVIYGVDKNEMAVELAKVALWLHTFTVGAPLSFLDHHLRCGDSLFGETVRGIMDKMQKRGELMLHSNIQKARASTKAMESIELNTDADIAGAKSSASTFETVQEATTPLASFMSLLHAFAWLNPEDKTDRKAIDEWLDGTFGHPIDIATGTQAVKLHKTNVSASDLLRKAVPQEVVSARFVSLLAQARELAANERFHHWQIAFPGVWNDWESNEPQGGFDAIIGNPPWDRIKFQEVE